MELASGQDPATFQRSRLVVDPSHIYWLDESDQSIRRVSKNGGPVQVVVANAGSPVEAFAVAGNQIFWGQGTSLVRGTVTNGAPTLFGAAPRAIVNVSVVESFVYWMSDPGSVFRKPLNAPTSGPGTETLHAEDTLLGPDWMRVLGTCAYYTMGSPAFFGSRLRRVCADGVGAQDLFSTNSTSIEGFDVNSSGAYFITGFSAGTTSIQRVALVPGTTPTTLFTSDELMVGLALGEGSIYFVETSNDTIWQIPRNGGSKSVFAEPVFRGANLDSVTTDESAVYWVDDGSIYKKAQ